MDSAFNLEHYRKANRLRAFSNKKLKSVLFSKGIRSDKFFTDDSNLYFKCGDENTAKVIEFRTKSKLFDSLNQRAVREYGKIIKSGQDDYLYAQYRIFAEKFREYQDEMLDKKESFVKSVSILKLWNTSILAAIIIGMISMSFIYRYLGSGVRANDILDNEVQTEIIAENTNTGWTKESEETYLTEMMEYLKSEADKEFNVRAQEMVKGYPIEKMLPYILEKDSKVAAFYIAIAKKESNWGKRVPVLNGEDCYNYLGYRGQRERMGTGGHTCFDSRKDAVDTISRRIEELITKYDRDTSAEMVVWKCGSSCAATGGQAAANKWIADVDMILGELNSGDGF